MPINLSGISPIIQAMQAMYEAKTADQNRARDDARYKDEQKQKDAEFKLREKQINDEHDLALKNFDLNKVIHDAEVERNRLTSLKQLSEMSQSGGIDLSQFSSDSNVPQELRLPEDNPTITIPGTGISGIPTKAIPGYDEAQQRAREQDFLKAFNTTKGTEAAAAPYKEAEAATAHKNAMDLAEFNRASQERMNTYSRDTQMAIENKRADTEKWIARLNAQVKLSNAASGYGADDAVVDNAIRDIYITGNSKLTDIPSKLRTTILGNAPKGYTPLTKEDQATFNSIATIQDIVNDARDLATKGSLNSGGITGLLGATIGFGDAGAIKNRIDGRLGEIARTLGKERGVLTQSDVERAKKLLYSPKLSQEENLQNVEKLQQLLSNVAGTAIKKYNPQQAADILNARGIDPKTYKYQNSQNSNERTITVDGVEHKVERIQ